MSCQDAALISLFDRGLRRQRQWWLAAGGGPERIAALLAAPLTASGSPPVRFEEISAVFAPLPARPVAGAGAAAYRYLLQLHARSARISCWRHYGPAIGWQRRCGPMALACFLRRFSSGVSAADTESRPRLRSAAVSSPRPA
ncbi:MAG: hypothetical protein R6U00_13260 [Prochlorococcaceae cyanobacterium]